MALGVGDWVGTDTDRDREGEGEGEGEGGEKEWEKQGLGWDGLTVTTSPPHHSAVSEPVPSSAWQRDITKISSAPETAVHEGLGEGGRFLI